MDIPLSAGARGWLETGEIDRHGHHHGAASFARLVEDELDRLADRIAGLLDAGWRYVRVVTDHGWLLLPGGLPLVKLPTTPDRVQVGALRRRLRRLHARHASSSLALEQARSGSPPRPASPASASGTSTPTAASASRNASSPTSGWNGRPPRA